MSAASKYITPSVLRARGWTNGLIARYLGDPDEITDNPHYKCATPMRLYLLKRVAKVRAKPKVKLALEQVRERRADRRKAASKAVLTKVAQAEARMSKIIREQVKEALKGYTWSRLVKEACASYNRGDGIPHWAYGKRDWADNRRSDAGPDDDLDFLLRIAANYVRHQLLPYDSALGSFRGVVGKEDARQIAKEIVLETGQELFENSK